MTQKQVGPNEHLDKQPKVETTEFGQAIEWGWIQVGRDRSIGFTCIVDEEDVKRCLHDDAADVLPSGARYQLRKKLPENYGRSHGMAWYHASTFADVETWGEAKPGYDPAGGFYLIGQFTTPKKESQP